MGALVGTFALVALAAQAASPPLVTERLPGFQVDLPRGDSRTGETSDYASGYLFVAMGKRPLVRLTWAPAGEVPRPDSEDPREAAAALGVPRPDVADKDAAPTFRVMIPGGLQGMTWTIRLRDDRRFWQTTLLCGDRSVNITTASLVPDFEALHQRVLRSFQCHPRPVRLRSIPYSPPEVDVVVALPSTWRRVSPPVDRLLLTDGTYTFSALDLGPKVSEESLNRILVELVEPKMRLGARQGPDWPVDAKVGATTGWITVRRCPEMKQTLLLMTLVESRDKKKTDAARALLGNARCRAFVEPPQSWPEETSRRR